MSDDSSWLAEVRRNLEVAPNARDPSEKNYHIRAALQTMTVQRRDHGE